MKVDRDERPDVDSRYQSAISAISGQGGWPLTGFLTPGRQTVLRRHLFPPSDTMGRPGFRRVLLSVAEHSRHAARKWITRRSALEQASPKRKCFTARAEISTPAWRRRSLNPRWANSTPATAASATRPSFPHSSVIDLLLERLAWDGGAELRRVIEGTLDGMAAGGFHDQIGGGFHRYSVDERWCVPHFEKMSYDNSELLKNYLHGYQALRTPRYKEVAEGLIAWVTEVLSDQARGGFYSSQDADQTLDDDGDYFTWTQSELARCSHRRKRRWPSFTTTSARTARCTTIPKKMSYGSRSRSKRLRAS